MSFCSLPILYQNATLKKLKIYCKAGFCNLGDKIFNGIKNSMDVEVVKTQGGALKAHFYDQPTYNLAIEERRKYIKLKNNIK